MLKGAAAVPSGTKSGRRGTLAGGGAAPGGRELMALRELKLDYSEVGPCEMVVLCEALGRNALTRHPVRALDLSMNQICGIDKLGQGTWCKDGVEALGHLLARHPHLRSASFYLNFMGPKALPYLRRALKASTPSFRALNLQFTDLFSGEKSAGGGGDVAGGEGAGEQERELRAVAEAKRVGIEL